MLGGWKPSQKYPTLTAQVEQVQRVLEILDSDKISFYMKRVSQLIEELDYMNKNQSPEERMRELGHPKDLHEKLHQACLGVKSTFENLPRLVERMEQKQKVHEACAQVMLGIAELES